MASEPTDEGAVNVDLDPELDEWLRSRAAAMGVEPESLLVQLVAAYRAAAELDGELAEGDGLAIGVDGTDALDELVEAAVAERLPAEQSVDERVDAAVEERLEAATDDVASRLDERLEALREDFQAKVEDVRDRVIQVKREADSKADADHDHEAFARLDAIGGRLADLEEDVAAIEAGLEDVERELREVAEREDDRVADAEAALEDLEERLTTVAWVVSDLREEYESKTGTAALEQLKRGAAEADVSRAVCENCGDGVEIALLTEPACPHCDATVTRVEPSSGLFGKPRLLVASQLESGEPE